MINSVTFSGRLGGDVELRQTPSGDAVANLNVAVDAGKDKTVWLRTSVWGKTAELAAEYLSKGSFVVVNGKLTDDSYVNKDGVNITRIGVRAFSVDFGPKQGGSQPQQAQAQPRQAQTQAFQDDLPF